MTLPALLVVAAFAAGIATFPGGDVSPLSLLIAALSLLLGAFGFFLRRKNTAALLLGLCSWFFLGALALTLHQLDVPANLVTRLVDGGRLDLGEPLRWRGRLRSDPLRLPWGLRYELALEEVEAAGRAVPVAGGLRLSYFNNERSPEAPPALRAGDRVEALVRARQPRNFGNPGAFDVKEYLAREGVHLTGSLRSVELLRHVESPPPSLGHRFARLRGRLLDEVDELFSRSPGNAAVVRAMLLGDRSFVDHEMAERFQKTAIYHVLVISGLHVAALVAFLVWTGRRLRLSRVQVTAAILVVLFFFVGVVEDRPPILRAAVMASIFLLSRLLFRRVDLLNTLAIAALLILIARPSALGDPSFQLSFLAAAMIGALGVPWVEGTSAPYRAALRHLSDVTRDAACAPRVAQFRLDLRALAGWIAHKLPRRIQPLAGQSVTAPMVGALRLWEVLLVSAAIQLGMLPVMAHYFHRVSPVGPLANVPAALLSGLLVPFGYLTLLGGLAWNAVGRAGARIVDVLVAGMTGSAEWFSQWSWNSYRIPAPPLWLIVAFFAALFLVSAIARSKRSWGWQVLAFTPLAAIAVAVCTYPFAPALEAGKLEVTALDVGQGDSILVVFPNGRTMLVDGGGMFGASRVGGMRTGLDLGEQVVSPYLWRRGLKRLDVIALTHAHQDHMDGLNAVLENFRVGELWVGIDSDAPLFRTLVKRANARGVRVVHRKRGDHFEFGGVNGLVLWPEAGAAPAASPNDDSLVLRLDHGELSFLLAGDIERSVERELAERGDPIDVDFLKVPHHGSRSSTTAELVTATTPRVGVISVGYGNPFGHPHAEVLQRMQDAGAFLLRTDRNGAVTTLCDGKTLAPAAYYQIGKDGN